MTTRIDGNQGTPLPTQVDRADATKTADRANKPAVQTAKADRVEVSQDAAFFAAATLWSRMAGAVQAAHETPAIRDHKVAAAKKALADGTLGQDAGKLADALIDHMLDDKK
jgi:flagellar biosynthesis anti-sigma factor FlgM